MFTNRSTLATIIGVALLGATKSKGSRSSKMYRPRSIQTLINLSKSKSKREKIFELDLSGPIKMEMDDEEDLLMEIPEVICKFTNLKKLNLSDNFFADKRLYFDPFQGIPECFKNLTNLKEINISNCQLDRIPDALRLIPSLEKVRLVNNNIIEIPEWISRMPNLLDLDLNHNKIRNFTSQQINIHLFQTDYVSNKYNYGVNLYNNPIQDLPFDFGSVFGKMAEKIGLNLKHGTEYIESAGMHLTVSKNNFTSKKALHFLKTGVPFDYMKRICLHGGVVKENVFRDWKDLSNHSNEDFIRKYNLALEDQELMNAFLEEISIVTFPNFDTGEGEISENELRKLSHIRKIDINVIGGLLFKLPSFLSGFEKLRTVSISGFKNHMGRDGGYIIGLNHISQVKSLKIEGINIDASELSSFHSLTYLYLDDIDNMDELPNDVCTNNAESLGFLTMTGRFWRTFPRNFGMLKNLIRLNLKLSYYDTWRSPIQNGVYFECPDAKKVLNWIRQGLPQKIIVQITEQCNKPSPNSELRRF